MSLRDSPGTPGSTISQIHPSSHLPPGLRRIPVVRQTEFGQDGRIPALRNLDGLPRGSHRSQAGDWQGRVSWQASQDCLLPCLAGRPSAPCRRPDSADSRAGRVMEDFSDGSSILFASVASPHRLFLAVRDLVRRNRLCAGDRQDPPAAPSPVPDGAGPQGAPGSAADQADPQAPQVMTRGPIHEAFAAPVVHDPAAGPVIPKAPPAPIQEMPPDQKPAGQNVQWIPGYWSWDVSRNDLSVDQRHLARAASQQPVGAGLLAPGRRRLAVGPRNVDSRVARPGPGAEPALLSARAAPEPGERADDSAAIAERGLDAGLLVVARSELCVAAGLLGGRPAQLDLDACALCVDAQRVSVRRRILGPAGRQPRPDVRAGLLPAAGLRTAQLRFHAVDQHRRIGRDSQPVRAGEYEPVPLR